MAKRVAKKKAAGGKKRPVESYDHRDKKRANNPPVGLVTPQTDPDAGQKKTYEFDPHLAVDSEDRVCVTFPQFDGWARAWVAGEARS